MAGRLVYPCCFDTHPANENKTGTHFSRPSPSGQAGFAASPAPTHERKTGGEHTPNRTHARCLCTTRSVAGRKCLLLPKSSPKWLDESSGEWDAVTPFGVRILKPGVGEWTEVSCERGSEKTGTGLACDVDHLKNKIK